MGRLQTQRELGFIEMVWSTYQTHGITGFFRGTLPRICLATPAAAVSWGTYETVRLALRPPSVSSQMSKRREEQKHSLKRIPSIRAEPSQVDKQKILRQHSLNA